MATKADWDKSARKWCKNLGLQHELITYNFKPTLMDENGKMDGRMAETSALPQYLYYTINVNSKWLKTATPEEADETSCHEHVHVLTSNVWSYTDDIIKELPKAKRDVHIDWYSRELEEMTSKLTNVFIEKFKK